MTGASGSGKSAVMRMIAGLDEVKNGEIWIGDKLVNSPAGGARNCHDFQNYTVYPRMTVLENVELGLRLRGIDMRKEIGKRTLEVLELLDLVSRFAKVKNLSDLWRTSG